MSVDGFLVWYLILVGGSFLTIVGWQLLYIMWLNLPN